MNVTFITVFLQGILSFFSPCVLPLLPVYMGYLSGGTLKKDEDGNTHYDRAKVMLNTIFFVIGISFAFFLLGMGLSVLGRFFSGNQLIFTRVGGIIVIMFGLYQLGVFGSSMLLSRELRLPFDISKMTMSPLTALVMGFVISFAWSPCIGPVLSSVLIMAASSSTGFLLIGIYSLGYVIPFLLVGVFTTSLLELFGKHRNVVRYTVKVGAVLMLFMGFLMFTGKLNTISSYLSQFTGVTIASTESATEETEKEDSLVPSASTESATTVANTQEEQASASEASMDSSEGLSEETTSDLPPAPDFTLVDQYGITHSLADYRGKVVFLNFWATWCPPCRAEMPYIQELYEEYSQDEDSEVVILGVAFPNLSNETDIQGITDFMEENGYTYPVLMDEGATLMLPYYITAYPTTFLIGKDGTILGYIPGGMTKDIMQDVIAQALDYSN